MVSFFYQVDKHGDNPLIRGWPGEKLLVAKKTKNWLHQVHFVDSQGAFDSQESFDSHSRMTPGWLPDYSQELQ